MKDASDSTNRDAIRAHLPHLAVMFGEGRFDAPMLIHDSANVPGTAVLRERSKALRYSYVETVDGGRVDIMTTDSAALAGLAALVARCASSAS